MSVQVKKVVTAVLCGRQNSGKTSLLMHLTHSAQHPVNFPGSSVERAESSVRVGDELLKVVDLPGISSMAALSPDEEVALKFLRGNEHPDVLCVVVDASKLSIELHLLMQLARLGMPTVVALNKNDIARSAGREVDAQALSRILGLQVIETNALVGQGAGLLREALHGAAAGPTAARLDLDCDQVVRQVQRQGHELRTLTERLDGIFLHRVLGLPILCLLFFGVFQLLFTGADPMIKWIESGQDALAAWVAGIVPRGALQSLLTHGIIKGMGSIVSFLPQIVLLFTLISILEATGYMARAAFLLDRVLSKVGLSGRSFVPLVSSFACAVPGILSARIIDNERDRLATIAVAPLMSCSARLPVYVLLIGAFFPVRYAGLVLFSLYALGICLAALVAWLLRRTALKGERSILMMELPTYQRPSFGVVLSQVLASVREFTVLAGTVILGAAVLIWTLSYYPRPSAIHERFEAQRAAQAAPAAKIDADEDTAYLEQSYLARLGKAIQPMFAPCGFDWRITIGILAAFPARELIIPTLGVLYSVGKVDVDAYEVSSLKEGQEQPDGLRDRLRSAVNDRGERVFTPLVALALMVFFALCSQCAGTLAAIRRESRSWRWPVFTFSYMTALAWLLAVLTYQLGRVLSLGGGA